MQGQIDSQRDTIAEHQKQEKLWKEERLQMQRAREMMEDRQKGMRQLAEDLLYTMGEMKAIEVECLTRDLELAQRRQEAVDKAEVDLHRMMQHYEVCWPEQKLDRGRVTWPLMPMQTLRLGRQPIWPPTGQSWKGKDIGRGSGKKGKSVGRGSGKPGDMGCDPVNMMAQMAQMAHNAAQMATQGQWSGQEQYAVRPQVWPPPPGVRTSSTGGGITAEASGKAAATEPDI